MTLACAPVTLCLTAALAAGSAVTAQDADAVGRAFADHCFNPLLTAETAKQRLGPSGARIEFYDLRPFSAVPPSPVTGRPATQGTDRRCEVAFDGANTASAVEWLNKGLSQEGLINRGADLPEHFNAQNGAVMVAAAQLNPNRIAVVQVGQRPRTGGSHETFINVERLIPLNEASEK